MENILQRIAALEEAKKNMQHELTKVEEDVKDIHRLTTAIEKVAVRVEDTNHKVDDIGHRLEVIEHAPAEDMRHLRRTIVGCVVTGILGAVIGALIQMLIG